MLQIDKAKMRVKELLKKGWKRRGSAQYDCYPYYMEGPSGFNIAVGQIIPYNFAKTLQENIDSYFRRAMTRMKSNGVTKFEIYGGTPGIPIPQYFLDFCAQNNIKIEFMEGTPEME